MTNANSAHVFWT